MRWVALLAGAVVLLLIVWLLVGPGTPAAPSVELRIPTDLQDRPALVKSAKQFIDFDPNPKNVALGVQLLATLTHGLTEAEWPQAAHDVFVGWTRIHQTAGSQETLDSVAGALLERLGAHLEPAALEALLRSATTRNVYTPRIDAALDRVASRPIRAYEGSRVAALVDAAVLAGDFKRASRFLSRCEFVPEASDEARAPAIRMARILDHFHRAGAGRAEMAVVVQDWSASASQPTARAALLGAGMEIAKPGKASSDFGPLKEAMARTRGEAGAAQYWKDVIEAYLASLPKIGQYAQTTVLEALAREYAAAFQDASYESLFWQKLGEANQEKHIAEAMWRIECLLRAARTAPEEARRLEFLRRSTAELVAVHNPARGREEVERLAPGIESAEGKAKVASLIDHLRQKEAEEKALLAKAKVESEHYRIQGHVDSLKFQLAQMKQSNGAPEVIRSLEQRIKDLEKKLTE